MNPVQARYKERVAKSFSNKAACYDKQASVQKQAAAHCLSLLAQLIKDEALLEGPALEIGCGTGLLSRGLPELLSNREITISDISAAMLEKCQSNLEESQEKQNNNKLDFRVLDAETLSPEQGRFSLIVSSFAIQWFWDPLNGIKRLLDLLLPGGILLFSLPGAQSCPSWQKAAESARLPYTRNPLPELESIKAVLEGSSSEFELNSCFIQESFDSAAAMLHSLKELGANTQKNNQKLSLPQMRRLLNELDGQKPLKESFQVITAIAKSPDTAKEAGKLVNWSEAGCLHG